MELDEIKNLISVSSEILSKIGGIDDTENNARIEAVQKKLDSLNEGIKTLESENSLLTIGIVGQMNVGKSSFLNALLFDGEPVLPKAATPMTAGLTVISYSHTEGNPYLEVEYYSQNDWEFIRRTAESVVAKREEILREDPTLVDKENILETKLKQQAGEADYASYLIVSKLKVAAASKIGAGTERIDLGDNGHFTESLDTYVGAHGDFTSVVKTLHIYLNDKRIEGIRIVDTPGINDPVITRDVKTIEFLREAHGVFMLMDASAFMSGSDIDFMNNRLAKEGISSIVVVANKLDLVCLGGMYRGGWKLANAVSDIVERLRGLYQQKIPLFRHPNAVKGVFFTSGGADSILKKLCKAKEEKGAEFYETFRSSLDADECSILDYLKRVYPDDFSDENQEESLYLLSQSDKLYNDFIDKEFIHRKNAIIAEKVSSFVGEYKQDIIMTVDSFINEINDEMQFLNSESIESLKEQLKHLDDEIGTIKEQIMLEINGFIKDVEDLPNKGFDLVRIKCPQIFEIPKESKELQYIREMRMTHKGRVNVSILNFYELVKLEDNQIDKLRLSVTDYWRTTFLSERKKFVDTILNNLTRMAVKGAGANVSDKLCRMLVNSLVRTQLNGMETLDVSQYCLNSKDEFRETIYRLEPSDFTTTFVDKPQHEAEKAIEDEAQAKLYTAERQIMKFNGSAYEDLKGICVERCSEIKKILEKFKKSFDEKISDEIETRKNVIRAKLDSKNEYLEKMVRTLDLFRQLKTKFVTV